MHIESKHYKIMIIDDNHELRNIIKDALQLAGYLVIEASDGFEGVKLVKENKPDLVLCDIIMPGMDGYEVKKQLSNDLDTMLIPFIFLTAVSEQSEMRKGMDLGADDYLVKPVALEDMLRTIEVRIEKREIINVSLKNKIDKLRTRIISVLPHEFLTPLNAILGFASILKEDSGSLSRSEIKEFASVIEESGNRLYHLIDNYLHYTKTLIQKEEVLLETIINTKIIIKEVAEIIALNYNRFEDLNLELSDSDLKIELQDLEYILKEIIENAFKFSKTGSPVVVKSYPDPDYQNMIIKIIDRGIGFPVENLSDIGAFNQFDRKIMEQQGSGLGLITSILMIQRYNGNFEIKRLDKGTELTVTLPNRIN